MLLTSREGPGFALNEHRQQYGKPARGTGQGNDGGLTLQVFRSSRCGAQSGSFKRLIEHDKFASSIGGSMSLSGSERFVSIEDYLEGEKDSPIRHEYVDGYVYAMAGASDRHNRAALNLASRLNEHLVDGPGEVFISDMKVRVTPTTYYYPDVVVCCDSPPPDPYFRAEPVLIVEVMSPTH